MSATKSQLWPPKSPLWRKIATTGNPGNHSRMKNYDGPIRMLHYATLHDTFHYLAWMSNHYLFLQMLLFIYTKVRNKTEKKLEFVDKILPDLQPQQHRYREAEGEDVFVEG